MTLQKSITILSNPMKNRDKDSPPGIWYNVYTQIPSHRLYGTVSKPPDKKAEKRGPFKTSYISQTLRQQDIKMILLNRLRVP